MVKSLSASSSKDSKKEEQKEEVKQPKGSKNFKAKPEKKSAGKHAIWFYNAGDAHGYLSNFYASPITVDGKVWPTTEHYFQAMKFPTNPAH